MESYFKQVSLCLVEIYSLASSAELLNHSQWASSNLPLLRSFITAVFEFSLFSISFDSISATCNSVDVSKKYLEATKNCTMVIFDKLCHKKTSDAILEVLYDVLRKELGFNVKEEKVYFRILHALNDPAKSARLCFLLDHIRIVLMKHSGDFPAIATRIHKLVYEMVLICSAPAVIKACSALISVLRFDRLSARGSVNSFFNSFQLVSKHKLSIYNFQQGNQPLSKTVGATEIIETKPVESFLDGKIKPSVHSMILSRLGQLMEPSAEVGEKLSSEMIWKLVDSPIGARSLPSTHGKQYCMILHLASESNLVNLYKALFHLDKLSEFNYANPKIETWDKYKELAKAKGAKTKKTPPIPELNVQSDGILYESFFYKTYQTTVEGIPNQSIAAPEERDELPVGWYLNSIRNFNDLAPARKDKKFADKRKVAKSWTQNEVTVLVDNIRQAIEKLAEPKEEDAEELKSKFLNDWNSLNKLYELATFVLHIGQSLNKFGFAKIPIKNGKRAISDFVELFESAIDGRIKPVTYEHLSPETKTLLLAKDAKETQQGGKVEGMTITVCETSLYRHFKDIFDKVFSLNHGNNRIIEGLNHNSVISTSVLTGSVKSHYLSKVSLILRTIYLQDKNPDSAELRKIVQLALDTMTQRSIDSLPEADKSLLLGVLVVASGWEGSLIAGSEVKLRGNANSKDFSVIQAPQNTGKLGCVLVDSQDVNISTQFLPYEAIQKKPEVKNDIILSLDVKQLLDSYAQLDQLVNERAKDYAGEVSEEVFQTSKWSELVTLQMASTLLIEMLYRHPLTTQNMDHRAFDLLVHKSKDSLGTPSLRLVFRLYVAWENIVDKFGKFFSLIYSPKSLCKKEIALKEFVQEDNKVAKDLSAMKAANGKESKSYRLPASSYLECLPRSNPKSSNYKMVRYWEKNIVPKIENFVKSSFTPFMMTDFFEQLRMSLRALDHIRACGIAFKLCDWGLPNGCFLPDADYDWDTIEIEEIEVGSLVSVKLEYRNVLVSQKIKHLFSLGLEDIVGEVLLVDHQLKYVLVLIRDDNGMLCLTLWVPQQCIKQIEYPIDRQGSSYSFRDHWSEFFRRYKETQTFISQNILINSISIREGLSPKVDTYQVLRWLIISEFNSNLISGWLEYESRMPSLDKQESVIARMAKKEPTRLNQLESDLQKLCMDEKSVDFLLEKLQEEAKEIVSLLNGNNYALNMKDKLEIDVGQSKNISPLNIFNLIGAPENSVCSIAVTFDKKAYLGLTSGIKFYSDKKGVHLVSHIFNNQPDLSLSNIPPILFQGNEVYYQFYYSVEGVPVWSRDQIKSDLPCVVHGIPYAWTPCCWMIDTLSSLLIRADDPRWTPKISALLKVGLTLSQEITGPSIIKQMLYKLSTRLVRKMKVTIRKHQQRFVDAAQDKADYVQALLGIDASHIDSLMKELQAVLEIEKDSHLPADKFPLYSSYTQDLIELLSTILSPLRLGDREFKDARDKHLLHQHLIAFLEVAEFFKLGAKLSDQNIAALREGLQLKNQEKSFMVLSGLPSL